MFLHECLTVKQIRFKWVILHSTIRKGGKIGGIAINKKTLNSLFTRD
jgi:hypothetical protein